MSTFTLRAYVSACWLFTYYLSVIDNFPLASLSHFVTRKGTLKRTIFDLSVKAKNEIKKMFNTTRLLKIDSYSCVTVMPTVAQENNAEINTANIFTERVLFKSFLKVQDWQHLLNSTMYIYFAELKWYFWCLNYICVCSHWWNHNDCGSWTVPLKCLKHQLVIILLLNFVFQHINVNLCVQKFYPDHLFFNQCINCIH